MTIVENRFGTDLYRGKVENGDLEKLPAIITIDSKRHCFDESLGVLCFSIAWPRCHRYRTKPIEAGLAFYDRLVDALLANVEPW